MATNCIFCKIIAGEIPAKKIYEDEWAIAFNDIKPIAPIHVLVVPKQHIAMLEEATTPNNTTMTRLFAAACAVAKKTGVAATGFRTVINTGKDSGQEVFHLHLHVFGGRKLGAME